MTKYIYIKWQKPKLERPLYTAYAIDIEKRLPLTAEMRSSFLPACSFGAPSLVLVNSVK